MYFTGLMRGQLTFRSVAVGLVVGTLMCMSNMYFGLQTGWITMGSLQSAILGFGIFKLLGTCGFASEFSIAENVIVQTTSVATATMPLAAGFVGVIPAMAHLTPENNPPDGPYVFSTPQLILWSLTLAFFGVFAAVPLRKQVIDREELRFPSGTATAQVIRALHANNPPAHRRVSDAAGASIHAASARIRALPYLSQSSAAPKPPLATSAQRHGSVASSVTGASLPSVEASLAKHAGDRKSSPVLSKVEAEMEWSPSVGTEMEETAMQEDLGALPGGLLQQDALFPDDFRSTEADLPESTAEVDMSSIKQTWLALATSFVASFAITCVAALFNAFYKSSAPLSTAGQLGWRLGANAGLLGQGMIMGPRVCASMLAGTVIGFAVLAPLALSLHWVTDASSSPQSAVAWVSWISLSIMISDSLTSLALLVAKYAIAALRKEGDAKQWRRGDVQRLGALEDAPWQDLGDEGPLVAASERGQQGEAGPTVFVSSPSQSSPSQPIGSIPQSLWFPGILLSSATAMVSLHLMFGMPFLEVLLAVSLALLVAILAVRALGDTDINPVSGIGKLTQVAFAFVSPGNVLSNLVAGAASEAAAQQAGDMMQDFKTAHLLSVSPFAQFVAMMIGSFASCIVSTGAYALYASVYDIGDPNGPLPAPTAQIWIEMAELVNGGTLPDGVAAFCWAGAALGVLLAVLPEVLEDLKGRRWVAERRWRGAVELTAAFLPNGIGFAIGMYVLPVFVLPRVVGSIAEQVWLRVAPQSYRTGMLVTASGLVLGEGIATLLVTIARALLA